MVLSVAIVTPPCHWLIPLVSGASGFKQSGTAAWAQCTAIRHEHIISVLLSSIDLKFAIFTQFSVHLLAFFTLIFNTSDHTQANRHQQCHA